MSDNNAAKEDGNEPPPPPLPPITTPVSIRMDSNDRFEDNFRDFPFWELPHDENGFNRLVCELRSDGMIYWKNQPVFSVTEIPGYTEEKKYYPRFVSSPEEIEGVGDPGESNDKNTWIRQEPLNFDGNLITNSWVITNLDPDEDDLQEEQYEDPVREDGITIQGYVTLPPEL